MYVLSLYSEEGVTALLCAIGVPSTLGQVVRTNPLIVGALAAWAICTQGQLLL